MTDTHNGSGIIPMQFKLVVKMEAIEEKTDGGVYLPDQAKDKKSFEITRGTLVAAGPAAFSDYDQFPEHSRIPQVGDRLWLNKYAGHQVKDKVQSTIAYRIIEDTDIVGIVDDSTDDAQKFVA